MKTPEATYPAPGTAAAGLAESALSAGCPSGRPVRRAGECAFSLVEIMMVVTLLTLIMVALMSVFSTTQTAFRSSVTQTDVLEGGRAAMDLLSGDFRQLTPSGGNNAALYNVRPPIGILTPPPSQLHYPSAPLNLWVSAPVPTIVQSLVGVSEGQMRTNQVQSVFLLTYQNQLWRGIGYFVDTNSSAYFDPLYRYDSNLQIAQTNLPARPTPVQIFTNFCAAVANQPNSDAGTNASHLLDGVVHFNVRAYDGSGALLTNYFYWNLGGSSSGGSGAVAQRGIGTLPTQVTNVLNATFYMPVRGESAFFMCSNTLPASVEIQMGVLEDRTLQRASTFPAHSLAQSNYLAQQVGQVHLFRQRVTIPNFDPAAYPQ